MPENLDGLVWLLLWLGPLLLFQRWLHREIQILLLIIVRRSEFVPVIFSLFFFPGVFLHELSHYLVAVLLQVKTGKFSLIPRVMPDGRLQLGFVETAQTDILRDALIGAAPLVTGSAFVAYAGLSHLHLELFWNAFIQGGPADLWQAARMVYAVQDFWLWFYLAFAVSSTMLPSRSDRRAWLPLAAVVIVLVAVGLLAGAGAWLLENVAPLVDQFFQVSAVVFAISAALHAALLLPIWTVRKILMRVMGLQIST